MGKIQGKKRKEKHKTKNKIKKKYTTVQIWKKWRRKNVRTKERTVALLLFLPEWSPFSSRPLDTADASEGKIIQRKKIKMNLYSFTRKEPTS